MSKEAAFKELITTTVLLWELVDKQAKDEGLWFKAKTAPEAYLQQELRKLHDAIECQTISWGKAMDK